MKLASVILNRHFFPSGGFAPWPGTDPFLFCVHHYDHYPASTPTSLGPDPALLRGRDIGQDFAQVNGWNMYHGTQGIPGFPKHPHRGFETLTVVRQGFVDHSDSLGATARYGMGDAQWLTTGSGICHAEMFPLVNTDKPNPMELFQIWINLPSQNKKSPPWFEMYWDEVQPQAEFLDENNRTTMLRVVGGQLAGLKAPAAPPNSWAADPNNHVVVATLRMSPGAKWTLPATKPGINRVLYFFKGAEVTVAGSRETRHGAFTLKSDSPCELAAGDDDVEFLLLQGRPINEPVVQQGPFVVNTQEELRAAFSDYRKTLFGGWSFGSEEPTHPRDAKRFAQMPDGSRREPSAGSSSSGMKKPREGL
jgi:redox-sensitive bicupin YhaK (pirin superfamily)